MHDNRKQADPTWELVDHSWAKAQRRDRYNMHRVDLLLAHPTLRMARPPSDSGALPQWHVLCEVSGCMMAQTQKNFTTHKRMKCAAHTYGTFQGHLLLAPHLRRQKHRLTRVAEYAHKSGRSHHWYVSCQNPGCPRDVCITNKNHEHRVYCKRCSYVANPARGIKDPNEQAQAIACVVAYRVFTYAGKRTLREPMMRCRTPECERLVRFSVARFRAKEKNWRCKRCNAMANRLRPYEAFYNYLVSTAAKRGIPVAISFKQFSEMLASAKGCFYCDKPLPRHKYSTQSSIRVSKTSLDRLDNEQGYTVQNTVACCSACNLTKFRWLHADEMRIVAALRVGDVERGIAIAKEAAGAILAHAAKLENINFACITKRRLV